MGCTTIHCTTESLWGRLETCAPVVYRRNWRIANPPQVSNLPHKRVVHTSGNLPPVTQ